MKRKTVILSTLMIFGALVSIGLAGPMICIDPGHGGSDPGAVGYCTEKVHNLDCSLKFRDWLNLDTEDGNGGHSWSPIMTRSTDIYVSLSDRVNYANNQGADRFVCIHANAFNGSAHGSETFSYTYGSSTSHAMRNLLQNELLAHGGRYNRGNKVGNYYVLRYTNMPAALTENAFVDNYNDAVCLNSASWRNNVALGFLHAMQRHYGYAAYTPSASVTHIVDNSSGGFSASSNWATGTSSSDKYGSDYRYRTVAAVSDQANWNVSLGSSGSWTVYAWWPQGGNRSNNAPYFVYHTGGSSVIYCNQETNGGKWNSLGSYNMNSGSNNVKLSCWTSDGDVVMADAIKWYK